MQSALVVIVDLLCLATSASALSISEHGVAHVFENGTAEMDEDRRHRYLDVCFGTLGVCTRVR